MKTTTCTNAFKSVRPPHWLVVNQHIRRPQKDSAGSPARLNGRNSAPAIEQPRLPINLEASKDRNKTRLYSEAAVALRGAFSRGRENTIQKQVIGVGEITLSTGGMAS